MDFGVYCHVNCLSVSFICLCSRFIVGCWRNHILTLYGLRSWLLTRNESMIVMFIGVQECNSQIKVYIGVLTFSIGGDPWWQAAYVCGLSTMKVKEGSSTMTMCWLPPSSDLLIGYPVKGAPAFPAWIAACAGYGQNHWACGYVSGQFQKTWMVYKCTRGLVDECLAITYRDLWFTSNSW